MNVQTWQERPTLTVEECAAVLRIGRSAAYQAVKAGQIPSIRVGRSIRVPRHRLERLLELHEDDEPVGSGLVAKNADAGGGRETQ